MAASPHSRDVFARAMIRRVALEILLCVVAGHRWRAATGAGETFPVLQCTRCGRTRDAAPGTYGPEGWAERAARGQRLDSLLDAREQPRPGSRREP